MTKLFFKIAATACVLVTPLRNAGGSLVLSTNDDQSVLSFGTASSFVSFEPIGADRFDAGQFWSEGIPPGLLKHGAAPTGAFEPSVCGLCVRPEVFALSDSRYGSNGLAIASRATQKAELALLAAASHANVVGGMPGGLAGPADTETKTDGVSAIQDVGVTTTPEPTSFALLATGLGGLVGLACRRARQR